MAIAERSAAARSAARQIARAPGAAALDASTDLEGPAAWFPGVRGKNVTKLGLHVAGIPLRKKVEIEVGEAVRTSTWPVVPIAWKATFPEMLFPTMTGKIELAPSSHEETRLTISRMYEAPLGKVGEQLDEALMHRVAGGTVRELAEGIAEKLNRTGKP